MKWIKELTDGDHVYGPLLVTAVTKGTTDKGLNYLNITFQDKTGNIEAKKWDVSDADLETVVPGAVVYVEGIVNLYKEKPQVKVTGISRVPDLSEIDLTNFQKVSPIPLPEMKKKLDMYLNSFKDKDVEKVTKAVIEHFYDKYTTYPAATKIHHEFGSGILHHSLGMADLADAVAKLYPNVDRDLLVAGALLHDIGKTVEYENPLMPIQTVEGKLIGHISIMYAEFRKIVDGLNIQSEVPILLEHMILSHHGKYEFGSPVLPCTREALLLSMIDLLDSKMMILDKAYDATKEGDWTEKLWMLDNMKFYKAKKR